MLTVPLGCSSSSFGFQRLLIDFVLGLTIVLTFSLLKDNAFYASLQVDTEAISCLGIWIVFGFTNVIYSSITHAVFLKNH